MLLTTVTLPTLRLHSTVCQVGVLPLDFQLPQQQQSYMDSGQIIYVFRVYLPLNATS